MHGHAQRLLGSHKNRSRSRIRLAWRTSFCVHIEVDTHSRLLTHRWHSQADSNAATSHSRGMAPSLGKRATPRLRNLSPTLSRDELEEKMEHAKNGTPDQCSVRTVPDQHLQHLSVPFSSRQEINERSVEPAVCLSIHRSPREPTVQLDAQDLHFSCVARPTFSKMEVTSLSTRATSSLEQNAVSHRPHPVTQADHRARTSISERNTSTQQTGRRHRDSPIC